VHAGQAGERLRCDCGREIEVLSVRQLRELEQVADEAIQPATWTVRQGVVFLGIGILLVAGVAAGAIAVLRPAGANEKSFTLKIDRDAIKREISALSPTQSYARLETVMFSIPGYSEQLAQGAVPAHLLACVKLLGGFEQKGPMPLAPEVTEQFAKEAGKRSSEIVAQQETRRAMNDWLWFIGIVAVVGILVACSSLVFPGSLRRSQALAGSGR
jgi:hypothetical protein